MGVYKRSGHWNVRFWINGREHALSAGGRTKHEAEEWLVKLKKEYQAKARGVTVDILLSQAILEHIETGEPKDALGNPTAEPGTPFALKENSWKRLKVSFRQIARYLNKDVEKKEATILSRTMVSEVTLRWVGDFIKWRRETDGSSNRTLRRDIDALSCVLGQRVELGLLEKNPIDNFKRDKVLPERETEIVVPSVREIQSIIDSMHEMHARFVAFQAITGVRQQEGC